MLATQLVGARKYSLAYGQVKKGKGFPYSIPCVGPAADPSVQAVSPQVTVSYPPGSRLPLLSARRVVTFPAIQHHLPLAGTKLYCLVTEAHRCGQLARGCYAALPRVGFEPTTYWSQSNALPVASQHHPWPRTIAICQTHHDLYEVRRLSHHSLSRSPVYKTKLY